MIVIDEYLAVRVVLADWPAELPDDELALLVRIGFTTAEQRIGLAHCIEGGLKLAGQVSADQAAQYLPSLGGQARITGPPPLAALLQQFLTDAHGNQSATGRHRSVRQVGWVVSALDRGSRLGGDQAARRSSDQPLSITRGRGAKLQVGPPTRSVVHGKGRDSATRARRVGS